jgi:hypothetical protein
LSRSFTYKIAAAILLPVREKQPYLPDIGFVNHILLAQGPLPFTGFLCQDVAAVGFGKREFAGSRFFEPLGGGPVRLDFWHRISPCCL